MSNLYKIDFANKKLLSKEEKEYKPTIKLDPLNDIKEEAVLINIKATLMSLLKECYEACETIDRFNKKDGSFAQFYIENRLSYVLTSICVTAQALDDNDFEMERILNDKERENNGAMHGFLFE